jgi:hypothetical protein
VRLPEANADRPAAEGVKAKIDEIEQQMVGDGFTLRAPAAAGMAASTGPAPTEPRLRHSPPPAWRRTPSDSRRRPGRSTSAVRCRPA